MWFEVMNQLWRFKKQYDAITDGQKDWKEEAKKDARKLMLLSPLAPVGGAALGFFPAALAAMFAQNGGAAFLHVEEAFVIPSAILGVFGFYRGVRATFSKSYFENVYLPLRATLKRKDLLLPKSVDEVSSFVVLKGSNFKYASVKQIRELSNGSIYIANMKISPEARDVTPGKLVREAEKTEIRTTPLDLTKTLLALGGMGSGKSVFLKNIYAQKQYSRAVINDVKGEYVEAFYDPSKDIIYNIYDSRSQLWDMFSDIKRNQALASVIAESIVLSMAKEKDFWLSSASKLLEEALLTATYSDDENRYNTVIEQVEEYKKQAVETNDKTAMSVYATLQPVLDAFRLMAFLESQVKRFNVYNFANSTDQKTLFLLLDPAHSKAVMPFTNALLTALISVLLSKPDTKSDFTLFLLDEFLNINIPDSVLTPLFTTSRSKGIQLVLASQYLPSDTQNSRITQLILNSRHILAIFKVSETSTLDVLKRSFGELEAVYTEKNTSYSESFTKTKQHGTNIFSSMFNNVVSSSLQQGRNVSEQTKKERKLVIDELKILDMPQHHFIYVQANPFLITLAKVEKFSYRDDEKPNQYFVERDLSSYYATQFARKKVKTETQPQTQQTQPEAQPNNNTSNNASNNAINNTSNNTTQNKYLDI